MFCTRAAFDAAGGFDERLFAAEEIAFSRAIGRAGRFVILREPVLTSGRKLRASSTPGMPGTLIRLLLAGPGGLRSRDRLALWYGPGRRGG